MQQTSLSPSSLLLDPNNYRFQELDNYVEAAAERFAEESVQKKAYQRLREQEGVQELKNSIIRNSYVPVERIVVRPYGYRTDKYVVIEGNRRIAAVKWILEDHTAGVAIPKLTMDSITQLPVVIVEEDEPDEVFRASLMGIRHVSGIKQWGGYQRAKLVAHMRDSLTLGTAEVAERLGMGAHEVNRRYRAYKALRQMQEDEEFGVHALPGMYAVFHEAVSLPAVKEWLHWNENEAKFCNPEALSQFYELITPREDDEGKRVEAKITSYSQVRELRAILEKAEAKRVLLDPSRTFHDAIGIAKQEEFSHLWISEVSEAIAALAALEIKELKNLQPDQIEMLQRLKSLVEERLQDYTALTGNSL
ncbi:MAG: hypothetical protein MN733_20795 [Nitrososphaera sp.]|nr:hypothetical protein [Nitrososphaera sp.]